MTTQPITPSPSEAWANIRRDIDTEAEKMQAALQEMQRLQARLEATLEADLGLTRIDDTEQVKDFIASAAYALQSEMQDATDVLAALELAGESVSAAVQLLEVHRKTRHIVKHATAKKLRESRPLATPETHDPSASWLNGITIGGGAPS
jgi:DNA-binding protein YbaB